jgi:hypothetical protein
MDPQGVIENIQWKLTLQPRSFSLSASYGVPRPGSTSFTGGGKHVELKGSWHLSKGIAKNPDAVIIRLTDSKTNKTFSFIRLSGSLLLLLDSSDRLMIGTAAWSYTLSKTSLPQ